MHVFHRLLLQIGPQHFIADAAWDEEAAATCRLSVAVDADGATCGTQLTGAGGVAAAKLLDLIEVSLSWPVALKLQPQCSRVPH